MLFNFFFFFQAEDGIRDRNVTGVQRCALPILVLGKTDTPLGAFYRRKRAQLGAPKALTATARKLACLIYRLIKAGQGYQEGDARTYELKYKDQILRSLRKRAAGLGFELVELPQAA